MRQFSLGLVCAGLAGALILAGCGGGSATPGSSGIMCSLAMAYADGNTSGNRIEPVAQAVNRQFNPCAIRQVQSLTVGLCMDHQQISELTAQLVFPNGSTQSLNLQGASSTGACLISGQLYQTTLTSGNLQSLSSVGGNWSVRVHDENQASTTPIGTLVGWSLRAEGLQ